MSEPEVRREAGLFAVIGFSHAKYVSGRSSWRIADDDQSAVEQTETNDSGLPVVVAQIFDFNRDASKDFHSIFEIQSSVAECPVTFRWVVGYAHPISVNTLIQAHNENGTFGGSPEGGRLSSEI